MSQKNSLLKVFSRKYLNICQDLPQILDFSIPMISPLKIRSTLKEITPIVWWKGRTFWNAPHIIHQTLLTLGDNCIFQLIVLETGISEKWKNGHTHWVLSLSRKPTQGVSYPLVCIPSTCRGGVASPFFILFLLPQPENPSHPFLFIVHTQGDGWLIFLTRTMGNITNPNQATRASTNWWGVQHGPQWWMVVTTHPWEFNPYPIHTTNQPIILSLSRDQIELLKNQLPLSPPTSCFPSTIYGQFMQRDNTMATTQRGKGQEWWGVALGMRMDDLWVWKRSTRGARVEGGGGEASSGQQIACECHPLARPNWWSTKRRMDHHHSIISTTISGGRRRWKRAITNGFVPTEAGLVRPTN